MTEPQRPEDIKHDEPGRSQRPEDNVPDAPPPTRATEAGGRSQFIQHIGSLFVFGVAILLAAVVGLVVIEEIVGTRDDTPTAVPTDLPEPTDTPTATAVPASQEELELLNVRVQTTQAALSTEQAGLLTQVAEAAAEDSISGEATMRAVNNRLEEIYVESTAQSGTQVASFAAQGTAIGVIQTDIAPISATQVAIVITVDAMMTEQAEPCRITPVQQTGAAIRRLPDQESDQMMSLPYGESLTIIGDNNGTINADLWWQVEFEANGVEFRGWIYSSAVDEVGVQCFEDEVD